MHFFFFPCLMCFWNFCCCFSLICKSFRWAADTCLSSLTAFSWYPTLYLVFLGGCSSSRALRGAQEELCLGNGDFLPLLWAFFVRDTTPRFSICSGNGKIHISSKGVWEQRFRNASQVNYRHPHCQWQLLKESKYPRKVQTAAEDSVPGLLLTGAHPCAWR